MQQRSKEKIIKNDSGSGQSIYEKFNVLKKYLTELRSVAVAYSSGVDSTFLLNTAHQVLGERVLAVTVHTRSFPAREQKEAEEFCQRQGIRQAVCEFDELLIPGFAQNPPDRCYLCKKEIFGKIQKIAGEHQIAHVAEGSNADDTRDYRPGMLAVAELGVLSPLREAGLTKEEIRVLSRECGLSTWKKPSFACLSSRFAYGENITDGKLRMVEQAEEFLRQRGFSQVRVRVHGNLARLEVSPEEISRLVSDKNRRRVIQQIKNIGFSYVTVDLDGYRTGSMNESLGAAMK